MVDSLRAIITDIEGTVAPISFVAEILFPFARNRLPGFLANHCNDPEVVDAMHQLASRLDVTELSPDLAQSTLLRWIDEDRKETPLKTIQGLIWAEGYADGILKAELYADVPDQLRKWHGQGLALYVYSSGSVAAQKLLFGHTGEGDLTALFDGYFDTWIGAKSDSASYNAILSAIALPASSVLFLSDSEKELDAAAEAGIDTALLARDGFITSHHPVHTDLTTIRTLR